MNPNKLYCDGGVIGKNPSLIGGTWAYLTLVNNQLIYKEKGSVTPKDAGDTVYLQ